MSALAQTYPVLAAGLSLIAGLLLGLVHFGTLRRVSAQFLTDGPVWRPLVLQLVRLIVLAAVLTAFAFAGALPLLAATLGVMIARALVLRRARGAA